MKNGLFIVGFISQAQVVGTNWTLFSAFVKPA